MGEALAAALRCARVGPVIAYRPCCGWSCGHSRASVSRRTRRSAAMGEALAAALTCARVAPVVSYRPCCGWSCGHSCAPLRWSLFCDLMDLRFLALLDNLVFGLARHFLVVIESF